jgi:hypothetical protein
LEYSWLLNRKSFAETIERVGLNFQHAQWGKYGGVVSSINGINAELREDT